MERAAEDLFETLATFDGLEAFCQLPYADQQRFVSWVGKAQDDASYWSRINALVLAMRVGPLKPEVRFEQGSAAEALG